MVERVSITTRYGTEGTLANEAATEAATESTLVQETMTPSQLERRQRILDATATLAARGGYEAVQMRDVAEHAEVALGTLYRYFPSKVHLLCTAMVEQIKLLKQRIEVRENGHERPADRVMDVLGYTTRAMQRVPQVTEALTRALMVADASAASEVEQVNALVTDLITTAIHGKPREPSGDDVAIARVLQQVWMSSILAWLSGRASAPQVTEDLEVATRLLLDRS